GAMGFTQDRIAWISVTHRTMLNAHVAIVITAAISERVRPSIEGSCPVSTTHVRSRKTSAVSQHATRLGQSTRFDGLITLRTGVTNQFVPRRIAWECGLKGCRRMAYIHARSMSAMPKSENKMFSTKYRTSLNMVAYLGKTECAIVARERRALNRADVS